MKGFFWGVIFAIIVILLIVVSLRFIGCNGPGNGPENGENGIDHTEIEVTIREDYILFDNNRISPQDIVSKAKESGKSVRIINDGAYRKTVEEFEKFLTKESIQYTKQQKTN